MSPRLADPFQSSIRTCVVSWSATYSQNMLGYVRMTLTHQGFGIWDLELTLWHTNHCYSVRGCKDLHIPSGCHLDSH